MKKIFFAAALGVVILASVFFYFKKDVPEASQVKATKTVFKEQESFDDEAMSREFTRLKRKAEEQEAFETRVQELKDATALYAARKDEIQKQREALLQGKRLIQGRLDLSAEEKAALDELNHMSQIAQDEFLVSFESIKR